MQPVTRYEHGISAVDAGYVRPVLAAVHLIVEQGRVALVDTGANDSLNRVLAALAADGLGPESVDYVLLTHIHLDHAGGAGAMMRAFPQARLVVHPRGARHMVDPSKLVASATVVYGASEVRRLYGEVLPVPAERVIEATDGLRLDLAGRTIEVLDTPGHARHHVCYLDHRSGGVFTGDVFGLSYREMDTDGRRFLFPTTTPTQFDPEAMHASVERIRALRPPAVYLTHYGELRDVDAHAAELHRLIDVHVQIAERESRPGPDRHQRIRANLAHMLVDEAERFGCRLEPAAVLALWATDIDLNAQGLDVWLDSRAAS